MLNTIMENKFLLIFPSFRRWSWYLFSTAHDPQNLKHTQKVTQKFSYIFFGYIKLS